ncbi:MAG TPA: hypothetical protein VHL59_11735, partial [Thermoanaerobaculia bacterium]|nr:hypothetical protein [Thermoanaerobaculia bacterium]
MLLATAALAHPPVSVAIDARGNIYYSDLNQVWRVGTDGKQSVAVPDVHTHELYLDAAGNLFGEHLWYEGERTDKWGHYLWRRDPAGRVTMVIPRTEGFPKNYGFARDRAGNQYFAERETQTVVKRTPAGRNEVLARGGFRDIRWMNATADGTVYFVDAGDLVRITPDRRLTRVARGLGSARHALMGIWLDRAGNVYLADAAHREVKRVTPAGKVSSVAKSTLPWSPSGGAFAPNGDLVLLEYSITNAVRVRRVKLRNAGVPAARSAVGTTAFPREPL